MNKINDIEHLKREILQNKTEIMEIQQYISTASEEIATVHQDLTVTRAHASGEAIVSPRKLNEDFEGVKKCISEVARSLEVWYKPFTSRPLSDDQVRKIRNHIQGKPRLEAVDQFIQRARGQKLHLVTEVLIRNYLCGIIMALVFHPFLPGESINDQRIKTLLRLQGGIARTESQDYSGRWRALTYKHSVNLEPRKEAWCTGRVVRYIEEISGLLKVITDNEIAQESLDAVCQFTVHMVNVAAQFKDDFMQSCTQFDPSVFLPSCGEDYDSDGMQEINPGREPSRKVVLGIVPGLQLRRSVSNGSGYTMQYKCAIIPRVVGDKSTLLSPPSAR